MSAPKRAPEIFRWPAVVAAVTLFGLIAALVGDGIWDGFSWIGLGVPFVLAAYFFARRAG
jgi:hypothetical protein